MKLGELLISRGLIDQDQLLQALQAQAQFGSRLGTNLVEMGFVSEQGLAQALSQQLSIPCVQAEEVAQIAPEVIGRISKNLAEEYRGVPFKEEGRSLCVCMADPANLEKVDELGFRLGCRVKPFVITELALNYALERYYDVPRESRFLTLSGPTQSAATFIQLADGSGGRLGAQQMDRASFLQVAQQPTPSKEAGKAETLDLSQELANVKSRDELSACMRRFAQALFDRAVFLELREGYACAIDAAGFQIDPLKLRQIRAPVTEGSLLQEALSGARVIYRDTVNEPGIVAVCKAAVMPVHQLTVIPILENRRVVCICVGQGANRERLKKLFPLVRRFLTQVSCALQILTLREEILGSKVQ